MIAQARKGFQQPEFNGFPSILVLLILRPVLLSPTLLPLFPIATPPHADQIRKTSFFEGGGNCQVNIHTNFERKHPLNFRGRNYKASTTEPQYLNPNSGSVRE